MLDPINKRFLTQKGNKSNIKLMLINLIEVPETKLIEKEVCGDNLMFSKIFHVLYLPFDDDGTRQRRDLFDVRFVDLRVAFLGLTLICFSLHFFFFYLQLIQSPFFFALCPYSFVGEVSWILLSWLGDDPSSAWNANNIESNLNINACFIFIHSPR